MIHSKSESNSLQEAAELERPLQAVEEQLSALGLALHSQDSQAVDRAAAGLHQALASAVDHFSRAAKRGGVPAPLRQRFALATGQVAAQREALARATASLDRAMDVLMPAPLSGQGLYSAAGGNDRPSRLGGSLLV